MDFLLTEEQQALRDLAAQIFADKATTERIVEIERRTDHRVDHELWSALADAQLLGVAIPEEFGGLGFTVLELTFVLEQQGHFVAPVPLMPTLVLGALAIAEYGTPAQKDRWLPAVVRGHTVLTGAYAERGANNVLRSSVAAVPVAGGWSLSGTKIAVPAAHVANAVLVPATTDRGLTIFIVDPKAEGVGLTRYETTARDVQCSLELSQVFVSDADVLGGVGDGAGVVSWSIDRADVAGAAVALGCCEQALALTAKYTSEREQFGRPLSTNQGVAIRAADAYIDIDCMRVTMWQAAWRLSVGLPARDEIDIAKYWAAEGGQRVVHATQHLHGGMGADIDYPVHRYFLWVKQLENTFGSAPQHLARLGRSIAGSATSDRPA
ncbi:MAG TPA: acyl-CoA dehydrogenase family protein [Acidimicrobiales bacterium]|nr:acyl-CoA dehydrogenase family protein [Acidimicrobiales bacterium]